MVMANITAQSIKFGSNEFGSISITSGIDKNSNSTGIQLISGAKYVGLNFQYSKDRPVLSGSFGAVLTSGYFETCRTLIGVKLGFTRRGEKYNYPLFGFETGFERDFGNLILGLKFEFDYRSDLKFDLKKEKYEPSLFLKIGYKF